MPIDANKIDRVALVAGVSLIIGMIGFGLWSSPDSWPYMLAAIVGAAKR